MDLSPANPDENIRRAEEAIVSSGTADLYVLPEMFNTGFITSDTCIAEPVSGKTLHWMQATACRYRCALCGSIAVRDYDDRCYNRFYFVHPDGSTEHYDKRHLFSYGGEQRCFTAGGERVVVSYCGVKILLQVCYDLRFPVFSRNNAQDAYDMIIYVASWPASRRHVWDTLLKARAIENQCYVAGVNRVGNDAVCRYNGGTVLISPYGNVLGCCEDDKIMTTEGVIDIDVLTAFRRKFPVLEDGDKLFP